MEQSNLIFLFSLPRSGSTLLQRVLSAHEKVETLPESWFLLNNLYFLQGNNVYAEYSYPVMKRAVKSFIGNLPDKKNDYLKAVNAFSLNIYDQICNDSEKYFLEKTPRYHLIAEDIMATFPKAKFIFLWRNPLSIGSSIIQSWGGGNWNLHSYHVDLYQGLNNLIHASKKYPENYLAVRYEDLINDAESTLKKIYNYLNLPEDYEVLQKPLQPKQKGMGDHLGAQLYSNIAQEPLQKWKKSFNSPLRKSWAKNYINWIGKDNMEWMGYDYQIILKELVSTKNSLKISLKDIPYFYAHKFKENLKQQIFTQSNPLKKSKKKES